MIYGSHYGSDFGEHHNYDPSLPSVRVAAEEYINTGKGDINEILESGKYRPSFGTLLQTSPFFSFLVLFYFSFCGFSPDSPGVTPHYATPPPAPAPRVLRVALR